MDFDVYRYGDGYLVVVFPPLVGQEEDHGGLTAEQASALMVQQGGHARDVWELLQEADEVYERSLTDLSRATVRAWQHARDGAATDEDIAVVRDELAQNRLRGRRTYLINALYMAGHREEALGLMVEVLEHSGPGTTSSWRFASSRTGRRIPTNRSVRASCVARGWSTEAYRTGSLGASGAGP
jgi:hypothetical protein